LTLTYNTHDYDDQGIRRELSLSNDGPSTS
jgi:hypothetical protein